MEYRNPCGIIGTGWFVREGPLSDMASIIHYATDGEEPFEVAA